MFILLLACNGDSPGPIGNIRNQDECTDDDLQLFYEDLDGDGFGGAELWACEKPAGAVQNPDDCNDLNGGVHPDAEELCSTARDDNCDGETNDGLDGETFFLDQDQDGFGDEPTVSCRWPDGYATLEGDCDDQDPEINPRADEVCNDLDDDCDEEVDEFVGGFYYTDEDGDGWGTGQGESMCDPPDEVAEKGGDCDDSDTGLTESGFYYEGTLQEIENGATWTFPDDGTLQICGGTWNVRIAATDVSASIVGVDAGEEVMLSGGKTSVPISVSGGSVTMTGLTLVDGVGEQGGCVSSVDAELFVQYIKARDCSATDGAGFFVRGGSLTVIDSSLRNNEADNLGGSFYVQDGDLVLDNVIVSRSEAAMGGGLYVGTGATAEVSRGEFHDCQAQSGGGTVAVVGGSLTSKQNTIRDSSSQGLGGAVLVESGDASFDGSTLQASSGQEGGGVYVDSGGSLSLIGVDCAEEGSLDNSPNDVATASDSWSWDGSCSATCDDQTCTDD